MKCLPASALQEKVTTSKFSDGKSSYCILHSIFIGFRLWSVFEKPRFRFNFWLSDSATILVGRLGGA